MASSSQQPSSSSISIRKHEFEVFLSFTGVDTRYNFTDHLFVYLRDKGINTFRDDQLKRGEEITSELLKTIEESRISIAVFSKNYAHSKWCLDELAKIMECRKEKQQIVLPVFYHVDPSDVRKQTGTFGEAFSIHERNVDEKKMRRWRVSLTAASNLSGYHVKDDEYESEIIKEIADDIHRKLDHKILDVGQHIVGMDAHLEELKSLINIGENDICMVGIYGLGGIGMHDLLQEMGWEIVRQTSPKEPGKWSRLWDPEDIYRVLTRNTGTETIEGIILDLDIPKSKQVEFTTEAFKMMKKLRLLKVHQDAKYDRFHWKAVTAPKVHFSGDFEFPSYELRYLQWDGYPLESLPSNFHGEELVELKFRSSNIKQLFQENKLLEKLKVIDLSHSQHLIEIPNISNAPNLEILILERCGNLESLPSDICKLKYLTNLRCSECRKLKFFPEIKEDMERLRELHLNDTSIQELPSSVKRLKGLEYLDLSACHSLLSLPDSICNLRSLKTLNIDFCWNLEKLPENLESLQCLEKFYAQCVRCQWPSLSGLCSLRELYVSRSNLRQGAILSDISCLYSLQRLNLSHCNLVEGEIPIEICHLSMLKVLDLSSNHFSSLPARISQLSELRVLRLRHCKMLQEIPELPSSLRDIDAHGCACLKTLSSSASLPWKRQLWCSLFNCLKSEVQDLECGSRWSDAKFDCHFYDGKGISIFMPGSCGIPEWIKHQKMGSEVTIELPMNWHEDKNLLGFVLCSLYVPAKDELEVAANLSVCELIINGNHFESLFFSSFCDCYVSDASDEVWLLYYPKIGIPARYRSNQWRNLEVIFDDYIIEGKPVKVEKSGVHLIYDQGEGSGAADTNVNIKRSLEDVENNPAEDPYNKRLRGPDPDHRTQNSTQLNQESSLLSSYQFFNFL
ncbi:disease resistance protein RPV1-like [Vitis riparia]|uniref:disease resistance protein RPV1-like n=1 Tax=Vitis riparia TaxID=96939 RepID=UPI00155A405F|nr:disease resistance protein RPV1-like [Vitis riparia]